MFFRAWLCDRNAKRHPLPLDRRPSRRNRCRVRRLRLEPLEDRRLLATFGEVGTGLDLVLAADERLVIHATSAETYVLALTGGTWSGMDSDRVTGDGSDVLTVTSAGQAAWETIAISDSAATAGVEFADSGDGLYVNDFSIQLTYGSPEVTFRGKSDFGTSDLVVATPGSLVLSGDLPAAQVSVSDGSIRFSANPAGEGGSSRITLEAGASLTSTGQGDLVLTGSGIHLLGAQAIQATDTANVQLVADEIHVTGDSPVVLAETGRVTIRPQTAGTAIVLGGSDSPGVLGLTDSELDLVAAETLQIGDDASGAIRISAAITPLQHLTLVTAEEVTVNAAVTLADAKRLTVIADRLGIHKKLTAPAGLTLQPRTPTQTVGLNDAGGDFNLTLAELNNLATGGTVIIGADGGTGEITIGSLGSIGSLNYGLTLRGGDVTFSNTLWVASNKSLKLSTGAVTNAAGNNDAIRAGTLELDTRAPVGAAGQPLVTTIGNLHGTVAGNLFLQEKTTLTIGAALSAGAHTIHLSNGFFNLAASDLIHSGSRLEISGGTLAMNSHRQTVAGFKLTSGAVTGNASTLTSASDFEVQSGTIAPKLAGSVGLNKTTSGTVALNNPANAFTGATRISGGTLTITADGGLGVPPEAPTSGHLVIDGGTLSTSQTFSLAPNRGIRLGSPVGAGSGTIDVSGSVTLTYQGIIEDHGVGGDRLIKTGSGTLYLAGVNTYRGGTMVQQGLVSVTADSGLGTAPETLTPGHLTLQGGGLRAITGFTLAAQRGIALGDPLESGTGILSVAFNQTLAYDGIIADHGSGGDSLVKADAGTLILGGDNTFSGGTLFADSASGIIQINHANALGATGAIRFQGSGTLRYGPGVAPDLSSRIIRGTSLTETTGIDTNGNDVTFATALAGNSGLEKLGGGTLTLASPEATAAPFLLVRGGELAVTAGTLNLTGTVYDALFGSAASALVRNATLRVAGGTVTTAGTLVVGYWSQAATLAVSSGALLVGTVEEMPSRDLIAGSSTSATVELSGGTIQVAGDVTIGSGSSAALDVRAGTLVANRLGHRRQGQALITLSGGSIEASEIVHETDTAADSGLTLRLQAGGLLTTDRIYLNRTGGFSGTHTLAVRFDGGTLRKRSASDSPLIDDIQGTGGTLVWNVIIEDGGAVMDTNGFDASVLRPLVADPAAPGGGLTKRGAGTLTLAAVNSFRGATAIDAGTLALVHAAPQNLLAGSPMIDVAAGAVLDVSGLGDEAAGGALVLAGGQSLRGTGTVRGQLIAANRATITPGGSPGILVHDGDLTLQAGAELQIEIGGNTPGGNHDQHDQIDVRGDVRLEGAALTVSVLGDYRPTAGDEYVILQIDGAAPAQGAFAGLGEGTAISDDFLGSGLSATITYLGGDGNDVAIRVVGFSLSKHRLSVSEDGTSDTLTAVLTAPPTVRVTLTVTVADPSETLATPTELVFTSENWNVPQLVTITGVDDPWQDGDQESLVIIAVDAARSDSDFASAGAQSVSVTTIDNDLSWQNLENPFDVNGDGFVTAADVLILIRYVNDHVGDPALPALPVSPPYYDVNDDGLCTALDVLLVVNWINTQNSASNHGSDGDTGGEGEGPTVAGPTALDARLLAPLSSPRLPLTSLAEERRCSADVVVGPAPDPAAAPVPPPAPLPDRSGSASPLERGRQQLPPTWANAVDRVWEIWEQE